MSLSSVLKEKTMDLVVPILPKDDLSQWAGRLMHLELPGPLREASISAFAKAYGIHIEEAEKPLAEYRSIGDFFTRKLKPGARPQAEGFTHPCDSKVAEAGLVTAGHLTRPRAFTTAQASSWVMGRGRWESVPRHLQQPMRKRHQQASFTGGDMAGNC